MLLIVGSCIWASVYCSCRPTFLPPMRETAVFTGSPIIQNNTGHYTKYYRKSAFDLNVTFGHNHIMLIVWLRLCQTDFSQGRNTAPSFIWMRTVWQRTWTWQVFLQRNVTSSSKALLCDQLNTCKHTFLEDYFATWTAYFYRLPRDRRDKR